MLIRYTLGSWRSGHRDLQKIVLWYTVLALAEVLYSPTTLRLLFRECLGPRITLVEAVKEDPANLFIHSVFIYV